MPQFNSMKERFEYDVKNCSLEELIEERQGMRALKTYIPNYPEMLKMVSDRISELKKELKTV
jgi:hypothetical protein